MVRTRKAGKMVDTCMEGSKVIELPTGKGLKIKGRVTQLSCSKSSGDVIVIEVLSGSKHTGQTLKLSVPGGMGADLMSTDVAIFIAPEASKGRAV